jgi:adenine-specific DNA-methyltransferase
MQTDFIAFRSIIDGVHTADGTQESRELLGSGVFQFPKPTGLIKDLIEQGTDSESLILDFFAGSGTTAHAVMAANAADGGTRRCVSVQLCEAVDATSDAGKAGYSTVAGIGRERIRRAAVQVTQATGLVDIDTGFRSLRVDSTNMNDTLRTPNDLAQAELSGFADSVKPDRTEEDLLFQVLVDWGLDLGLPFARESLRGREIFRVADDALIACFSEEVSADVVTSIAQRQPLRAVFRNSAFRTDADRINAEQLFRELSPNTEVKTI